MQDEPGWERSFLHAFRRIDPDQIQRHFKLFERRLRKRQTASALFRLNPILEDGTVRPEC